MALQLFLREAGPRPGSTIPARLGLVLGHGKISIWIYFLVSLNDTKLQNLKVFFAKYFNTCF